MEWQNLKEKNSGRNYYFYFSEILKHYLILKFLKTIEPQSGGRNVEAGILCNHSITIISLRIDYKILLLTFKCIYGLAPTYLSDLISIKSNSLYNLRSTGKFLVDHPKGKMLTTVGSKIILSSSSDFDLKPIFLRSIFIVCNLVYFIITVMYFRFLLNI